MAPVDMTALESRFQLLFIGAAVFCTFCALFGIYLVLFVFAIWSTYNRNSNDSVQKRLRIVTLMLFFTLVAHCTGRAVQFGQSRLMVAPPGEQLRVDIPLLFVTALTTTLAGFISDGLLAWRFYNVFGCRKWALWVPLIAVTAVYLLGIAEDCLFLSAYDSSADYDHLRYPIFKMNVAWAWATFAVNTIMTVTIVTKILLFHRKRMQSTVGQRTLSFRVQVSLHALCESALVTWIGLVLLEIASLRNETAIFDTPNFKLGDVIGYGLPVFFGISQCLITVRVAFTNNDNQVKVPAPISQILVFATNNANESSPTISGLPSTAAVTPSIHIMNDTTSEGTKEESHKPICLCDEV